MRGDPNAYRFVSVWPVGADPDSTYTALYEVVEYAQWWPEVREARRLDERRVRLRTRSLLPYDIAFTLWRTIADPASPGISGSWRESDSCACSPSSVARHSGPTTR